MRITKSIGHHTKCSEEDCEKLYCKNHRLIYYWCETAHFYQHSMFDGGDCPDCRWEARKKALLNLGKVA